MKTPQEIQKTILIEWIRAADKTVSRVDLESVPLDLLLEIHPDVEVGGLRWNKVLESSSRLNTAKDSRLGEILLRSTEEIDMMDWNDSLPQKGMSRKAYLSVMKLAAGMDKRMPRGITQKYSVAFVFISYQYLAPWDYQGWGIEHQHRINKATRALYGTKKQQVSELFRYSHNNRQVWGIDELRDGASRVW